MQRSNVVFPEPEGPRIEAIIYLIFSTILEYIQRRGEKKLGKYGSN